MQNNCSSKIIIGIILFLSLSANVFMFGMVTGRGGADGRMARFEKIGNALASYSDLSDASQEKVKAIVKRDLPDIKKQAEEMKERRQLIKAELLKPDYKREDVEKIYAQQREALTALQTRGQAMALDLADSLSPEERAKVLAALENK
jgi:uncharacterized membrane protein